MLAEEDTEQLKLTFFLLVFIDVTLNEDVSFFHFLGKCPYGVLQYHLTPANVLQAKLNTSALRDLRKRHRPVPGEEKIRYTYRLERILTAIDTLKEDLHAKLDKIAQKANMSLSMGIEKKPSVKEQLDRARQYKDPETEQPKFINQGLSPRKKSVRDQLRGHRDRDDKLEPRKKADKGWDMDR